MDSSGLHQCKRCNRKVASLWQPKGICNDCDIRERNAALGKPMSQNQNRRRLPDKSPVIPLVEGGKIGHFRTVIKDLAPEEHHTLCGRKVTDMKHWEPWEVTCPRCFAQLPKDFLDNFVAGGNS